MRTVPLVALAVLCSAPPPVLAQDRHAPVPPDSIHIRVTAGTALFFDPTPDGKSLILDLLGQLWLLPITGGPARLLADTVEASDDRQPAVSPDGRWLATRSDRPAGRGIWLHSLTGLPSRPLTDSALILGGDVGVPSWAPDGNRLAFSEAGTIVLLELAIGRRKVLRIAGLQDSVVDEPAWSPDGRHLLVTGPWQGSARPLLDGPAGAAVWEVDLATNTARRLSRDGVFARSPVYAPNGHEVAYFAADSNGEFRLVVQGKDGKPATLSAEPGIEPWRVRWTRDGRSLLYVANGHLRRVPRRGGPSLDIPFTAELRLARERYARRAPHFALAGEADSARGFSGLAIAPAGDRIAMLALGRLWLIGADGATRAAAAVPVSANGLTWSPDGNRVAWSAGPTPAQELWVADVRTGQQVRVSHSAGSDSRAAWSPDGRWVAFLHGDGHIHLVSGEATDDRSEIVGPEVPFSEIAAFAETLNWTPTGDTLLVYGMNGWPVAERTCVRALLLPLHGEPRQIADFPCRPAHVRLAADGTLVSIENGVLTERRRTDRGWPEPFRVGREAALHPSVSRNGALLFVTADGLRVRAPDGTERHLGWPVRFRAPLPRPLLIHNVRLARLDATADSEPSDVLLLGGRIAEIARAGQLQQRVPGGTVVLDARGQWAIPGLIDAHTHFLSTGFASVRAALYYGVTTVREMWHPLAESAAFRDDVAAGAAAGARIVVSGPPFYPAPTIPAVTSDFLWIPTDSATTDRGLELLRAFGAGHVKLRYTQSWSAAGAFLRRAHAFGFPSGGHCAHALVAVAAGIDTQEHADGQCGEWQYGIHEDIARLYAAAGITVVPASDLHDEEARTARDTLLLYAPDVLPFRFGLRTPSLPEAAIRRLEQRSARARADTRVFFEAGVRIAAGADAEEFPGGLIRELQSLVAAGLSPAEALRAGTSNAAAVLGLEQEIGRLQPGMRADLVLLDADPVADIRNVARIRTVIQDGRIVDRAALLTEASRGGESSERKIVSHRLASPAR